MADKRMFSKQIIDSDAFLDMPLSSQALYFHLNMRADDDGFINNPKKIQRMVGCGDDELKLLIAKKFVIPFESGVCVIKHWLIHNYIRKDTYKETVYTDEKSELFTKKNRTYTLNEPPSTELLRECNEDVTQYSIDKNSKDKIKEVKNKKEKVEYIELSFIDDTIDKVKLTKEQYDKLLSKYGQYQLHKEILALDNYIVNGKGNKYKDHYRALNIWCGKNKEVSNNGIFRKNTTEGKKFNIKREEFDPNKYNTTEGDMPI